MIDAKYHELESGPFGVVRCNCASFSVACSCSGLGAGEGGVAEWDMVHVEGRELGDSQDDGESWHNVETS